MPLDELNRPGVTLLADADAVDTENHVSGLDASAVGAVVASDRDDSGVQLLCDVW